jgi:hypothetical protein
LQIAQTIILQIRYRPEKVLPGKGNKKRPANRVKAFWAVTSNG